MIDIRIAPEVFNPKYLPFLHNRDRYLVFYGGGSSGKSYFIAQRYVYMLLRKELCNLLVVRQTGDSNRRSTFPLLCQVIRKWKLERFFSISQGSMHIRCIPTGNQVVFAGLDDVEKIKSITFDNGVLTDIWVEEATQTRQADINQLKVRLRGGEESKQMVLSFNPVNVRHWIKAHFIDSGLATVCFSTYLDNQFLSGEDKKALEDLKFQDEYTYRVYCLGQWGVLGRTVFDAGALQRQLDLGIRPLQVGQFQYDYDGLKITNIRWVEDPGGCIRLYRLPGTGNFCLGGDTAGDGSDYFTAQVLAVDSGSQAAVLRHRCDADQYAKQVYCLGRFYNDALVAIEANFDSYPLRELQRLQYPRQYVRRVFDSYTGKAEKRFGFKTTSLTRPAILSRLTEVVREHSCLLVDRDTLEELLTIVRNEQGRIEAPAGGHDDLMMALAIAFEIRDQGILPPEPVKTAPKWGIFRDSGEEISVI